MGQLSKLNKVNKLGNFPSLFFILNIYYTNDYIIYTGEL